MSIKSYPSPMSDRIFSDSKEAMVLGLSSEYPLTASNTASHIGSYLRKRSVKLLTTSTTSQQQQLPAGATTQKQTKKQSKSHRKVVTNQIHHVVIIESDREDSCSFLQPDTEDDISDPKKGSCRSFAPINHVPSSKTKKFSCGLNKTASYSLQSQSSASTTASYAEEDYFSTFERFDECDFTRQLKKLKSTEATATTVNSCSDFEQKSGFRKNSFISNCSDTMTPQWHDAQAFSENNLTPEIGSLNCGGKLQVHTPSTFSLEANLKISTEEEYSSPLIEEDVIVSTPHQTAKRYASDLATVKVFVEQRMGRLAAEVEQYDFPCCTFSIRCFLKHSFSLQVTDVLRGAWCPRCDELLISAREFASKNDGQLISETYIKTLKFKCSKLHEWESSHSSYRQRWCVQCHQLAKESFKQYIREEEVKKQAEYERNQEQIYREARRKALENEAHSAASGAQQDSSEYCTRVITAARQVQAEVEKIAETQARSFQHSEESKDDEETKIKYEDAKEVLKVLLFPDQIMSMYLLNLSTQVLNQYYRTAAKAVHPDKNKHPRAAEAFQKLHRYYSAATNKNQ